MGIILYILISYVVSVCAYTYFVRNNAMNKHNPHVNVGDIVKEGMKGMAIGFAITIAAIFVLYNVASFLLTVYYC